MGRNQRGDEESPASKETPASQPLHVSTVEESQNPSDSESMLPISSGNVLYSEISADEESEIDVATKTEHLFITVPSLQDLSFTFNR